jgi:hypothetical protein
MLEDRELVISMSMQQIETADGIVAGGAWQQLLIRLRK